MPDVPMPLQEDYQVALDSFHGPMDLLLYLIRRAEVDIQDIPIATITDQYLALLNRLHDVDIDVAGEFLVMASTLVEIKSRVLMPVQRREGDDGAGDADGDGIDASDPRSELVQQLLAYQKYRIASEELEQRRVAFSNRCVARPARAQTEQIETDAAEPVEIELEDVHVLDLSEAYERIIASIDLTRLGEHMVEIDDTPIALHQEDLLDRITRAPELRLSLTDAFEGQNLGQRLGLFLATLELVRLRKVTVEQESINSPIVLVLNDDPNETPNTPETASAEDAAGGDAGAGAAS